MCSRGNLHVEHYGLVSRSYYWVLGWGILLAGPKMYMYLEFWGCDLWTRYNRLWSLGWISMLWSYITVRGFTYFAS